VAFGGKESNATWVAAAAAIAANHTGRPVKLRLPREVDMLTTGKRHGFDYRYTVGFDGEGRVLALDAVLAADAGWSLDMTPGVVTRALTSPPTTPTGFRTSGPSAMPAAPTSSRTRRSAALAGRRVSS
jgi:xanthine dehydrogenase molybdopterin-binding subunit B